MGKKLKADSDNKYEIVLEVFGLDEDGNKTANTSLVSITTEEYIGALANENNGEYVSVKNNGDEDNRYFYGKDGAKLEDGTKVTQNKLKEWAGQEVKDAWVVNASGTLIKSKNKCKDGDDYIINVDNYKIQEIYEELD